MRKLQSLELAKQMTKTMVKNMPFLESIERFLETSISFLLSNEIEITPQSIMERVNKEQRAFHEALIKNTAGRKDQLTKEVYAQLKPIADAKFKNTSAEKGSAKKIILDNLK